MLLVWNLLILMQCLRLLRGLTAVRCPSRELLVGKRWPVMAPHTAAIIMELQATSMVSAAGCEISNLLQLLLYWSAIPGQHNCCCHS